MTLFNSILSTLWTTLEPSGAQDSPGADKHMGERVNTGVINKMY